MAPAPFSVLAINGGSSSIKFAVYPAGTLDKPIIFACHGHPLLIHRLTYRRTNHHNLHVRGYKEEGTAARRSRRRSGESARRNKT